MERSPNWWKKVSKGAWSELYPGVITRPRKFWQKICQKMKKLLRPWKNWRKKARANSKSSWGYNRNTVKMTNRVYPFSKILILKCKIFEEKFWKHFKMWISRVWVVDFNNLFNDFSFDLALLDEVALLIRLFFVFLPL